MFFPYRASDTVASSILSFPKKKKKRKEVYIKHLLLVMHGINSAVQWLKKSLDFSKQNKIDGFYRGTNGNEEGVNVSLVLFCFFFFDFWFYGVLCHSSSSFSSSSSKAGAYSFVLFNIEFRIHFTFWFFHG